MKLLNIIDEFTRECLAVVADYSINADKVVATLGDLAAKRGAPKYLRMDNGPELVAYALSDWCRFARTGSIFIDPRSPGRRAWFHIAPLVLYRVGTRLARGALAFWPAPAHRGWAGQKA